MRLGASLDEVIHGPEIHDDVTDEADAEILFLDDMLTRFELVVAILADELGPSERSAHELTSKISAEGEATVACRKGRDAKEMRRRAIDRARGEGFPLRVIVRARA